MNTWTVFGFTPSSRAASVAPTQSVPTGSPLTTRWCRTSDRHSETRIGMAFGSWYVAFDATDDGARERPVRCRDGLSGLLARQRPIRTVVARRGPGDGG